jgi:hypothetical protein
MISSSLFSSVDASVEVNKSDVSEKKLSEGLDMIQISHPLYCKSWTESQSSMGHHDLGARSSWNIATRSEAAS